MESILYGEIPRHRGWDGVVVVVVVLPHRSDGTDLVDSPGGLNLSEGRIAGGVGEWEGTGGEERGGTKTDM